MHSDSAYVFSALTNNYITHYVLLLIGECGEHITKGNNMKNTYTIGDIYTTTKTQETGTIKEIVVIKPDLVKIRLDVAGDTRWTTWKPE
jgi:hypothetical protein